MERTPGTPVISAYETSHVGRQTTVNSSVFCLGPIQPKPSHFFVAIRHILGCHCTFPLQLFLQTRKSFSHAFKTRSTQLRIKAGNPQVASLLPVKAFVKTITIAMNNSHDPPILPINWQLLCWAYGSINILKNNITTLIDISIQVRSPELKLKTRSVYPKNHFLFISTIEPCQSVDRTAK